MSLLFVFVNSNADLYLGDRRANYENLRDLGLILTHKVGIILHVERGNSTACLP